MQLYLHATRHEALTASSTALTRWSLETNPATVLAQVSTAPEWLFPAMYNPVGQMIFLGEITGAPNGTLFALPQLPSPEDGSKQRNMIEWRQWDDLLPARTSEVPYVSSEIKSLGSSPDGRWLVIGPGYPQRLFLLDWQTGEVVSHHAADGYNMTGLIFDPTSTFVAGLFSGQGGGFLQLWRLDPVERFSPRPMRMDRQLRDGFPPDVVSGRMALTRLYRDLDTASGEWLGWADNADIMGTAAFSPDSRLVSFSYPVWRGFELMTYEVASGQRLWYTRGEVENTGPFLFSPDGRMLLVPVQGSDLLVYRVEDGALVQRLPTGLSEPVQALAFDHDGRTLWLATEEQLVQYQPQR